MALIQHLHEGAIRNRRSQVAKLDQPIEPKLPHAVDIGLMQVRTHDAIGKQGQALLETPGEHSQADERRIGGDLDLEMRTNAGKRVVHFNGRACTASFIEHISRERCQAWKVIWIGGRPGRDDQQQAYEGQGRFLDAPEAQAIVQSPFDDGRKGKRRIAVHLREP
jgi:hypothetical protein